MTHDELLDQMSRLGYPLLNVQEDIDVCAILARVVESDKGRYWEGFPVLLANACRRGGFDYTKTVSSLKSAGDKSILCDLFLLSLALYEESLIDEAWVRKLSSGLGNVERLRIDAYRGCFKSGGVLKAGERPLDAQRVKTSFNNYLILDAAEVRDLGRRREDLSLAFALAQVFSPKQKELFQRKLKGELFTKTEKEYFSRVVKKKVMALANVELHQLAQKVLVL
jgi:hypothetical protein